MDIVEFRKVLTAFADEPTDVDVRLGKVVAQVREDLIDINLSYAPGPDRLLRVTENDVHYPARSWLINRVARLPQLADRILSATAPGGSATDTSPFVVPSGQLSPDLADSAKMDHETFVEDAVEALLRKATDQLPGATSVLYLTSDAGEGKTTLINRAARIQAERYKAKTVGTLLVPIPLSGRTFLTFDDAVIAALVNKLRFSFWYFDAFVALVRMGAIVPAFDGYEEMLVEGSKGEAVSALGNLVQTMESSGTIVIAARKAFFEYISFKTQARLLDAIGNRSASFSRLGLLRWTQSQFCEYGRLRGTPSPDEIYQAVAFRLSPDHPLLTRAVLVRRLFDVALTRDESVALVTLLGNNPQDYFYTFVEAIVKREASEKWLSRISGDVMEPLLTIEEHHQLLAMIAQEMWQSSTTSLRYDVLDTIVDLFAEAAGKRGVSIRQVKERLRQHSLLATDSSRGQALAFDHEDFQNFYLGEGLGLLLSKVNRSEIQAFLSVNLVPVVTVEQALQYLHRHTAPLPPILQIVEAINASEAGFTFCKENCSALAIRIAECLPPNRGELVFADMFLSPEGLTGRNLRRVRFSHSHFQPSGMQGSALLDVTFKDCEFERLDFDPDTDLSGCIFDACRIESILLLPDEDQIFDPALIRQRIRKAGASLDRNEQVEVPEAVVDLRVKVLERLFRSFLHSTQIDDDWLRMRLGKSFTPVFYGEILSELLARRILEQVPWRGRGSQQRYKLSVQMSDVDAALGRSKGDFDRLLDELAR